ncbi:2,5-diamino-6-(ribosylamino)-4(3H)-pyrimidinone 5'-phosphate reductase [Methanobrevibacter gottschalkii]|uniref:2,5-diamino-6-(ribosylamino)-4(3H)-pyrimidinone 5'-phosphate reductase n=1 Tax=Methanobrevibacter gottschalkii TaxID=190974 RepID=A0A1H7Q145_9EURY|nr:2,5-diamino-6-(ribosylamino)-4(3H)-pyrimidinone 5'-phosphate reductase [Methanobrevibacter gottschalkii]SEL41712.1 2,5-diamino-6-(ribosylamino)-4(3H)-pyrimidinone 5'-phosphate reductase [Methanobrevibacter gottschalkii]
MMPYVILSAAMTLDGKIATKTGSSNISGKKDLLRVHELRKECNAIMVGIGTVIADDPRLTVHKVDAKPDDNPVRVVVDSKFRTPADARITNSDAETIIACAREYKDELIASDKYETFKKRGVKFFYSGSKRVDLKSLMSYLHEEGIDKLMLEGGSTLNFSMIKAGLIDEIRICVAPMIVGGCDSKTFFDGEGFDLMGEAVKLELTDSYQLDKDLILTYKVLK